jgi:hypothetical protein
MTNGLEIKGQHLVGPVMLDLDFICIDCFVCYVGWVKRIFWRILSLFSLYGILH